MNFHATNKVEAPPYGIRDPRPDIFPTYQDLPGAERPAAAFIRDKWQISARKLLSLALSV